MYKNAWVGPLCLAALLAIPVLASQPSPLASDSANPLLEKYFDIDFPFHPTAATSAGFHSYDPQLEDFSRPNLDREAQELRGILTGFQKAIQNGPPRLTADDLRFVESQIRARLLELETIRMWQKDPDLYASSQAYSIFVVMKRDYAPADQRLRSVIARERQIPAVFAAARQNLQNPPRVYTEVALEQLPGTIDFFRNDVPKAFSLVHDKALQAEFQATNQDVVEAYKKYESFVREDLLPVSHGDFRLG